MHLIDDWVEQETQERARKETFVHVIFPRAIITRSEMETLFL